MLASNSKDSLWEVNVLLSLSQGFPAPLKLGQCPPLGSGLLGAKVKRFVLAFAVVLAQVLSLCLTDDSQDTGNCLAHHTAVQGRDGSWEKWVDMSVECVYNTLKVNS